MFLNYNKTASYPQAIITDVQLQVYIYSLLLPASKQLCGHVETGCGI